MNDPDISNEYGLSRGLACWFSVRFSPADTHNVTALAHLYFERISSIGKSNMQGIGVALNGPIRRR